MPYKRKKRSTETLEIRKKRQVIENRLYRPNIKAEIHPVATENELNFIVDSWKNDGSTYTVKITNENGINFQCDCGDQFSLPPRKSCKHIANIIATMVQNYVEDQLKEEEDRKSTNDLTKMLNKILKLDYKQMQRNIDY